MKSIIVIQIVFGMIGFTIQVNPSDEPADVPVANVNAEINETEAASAFDRLDTRSTTTAEDVTDQSPTRSIDQSIESSVPFLNEEAPNWIRDGITNESEELRFPIATSLLSNIDECRAELDSVLIDEVRHYIDKNVLRTGVSASELSELTVEFIKENLLVPDREFDDVVDRPSGTYHRLWRQIFISKSDLATIRSWENRIKVIERTKEVGFVGGSALLGMTLLSGMIGLLARREKVKLKE